MTKKQRLFFQELLASPSLAEAARRAGYSTKSCRVSAHQNITKYNAFYMGLLDHAGLSLEDLSKTLKEGLNSDDPNVRFRYFKFCVDMTGKCLKSLPSEPFQINL